MKWWDNIFKVIVLLIGLGIIAFNALLYNFCEQQKTAMALMADQQKAQMQDSGNKFKYQQDQIVQLSKDLQDAQEQIKNQNDDLSQQKDAFVQEVEKRQEMENENKSVQKSLTDIEAEADAIKDNMKAWQKDYVAVLADLEKKMDASQLETKSLETNLTALNIPELKESIGSLRAQIELLNRPPVNDAPSTTTTPASGAEQKDLSQ